jgi:hypothetical protein
MKFIRILPEICASTSWLFSNCTRNIALGNASRTVPSSSITSAFAKAYRPPTHTTCTHHAILPYLVQLWYQRVWPNRYTVRTSGPFSVTATVFSKCADKLPSTVTTVQSSAKISTSYPPAFTIGSIASVIPVFNLTPLPGLP